ncbi:MAG TPA: glycogen debranching N-terminal domain-containing protein, partial [Burkholderiaceae bacterium]|nr:glycogen debranching N-terminal domain-containing protein [Burkholderiaceae bacterium]
MTDDVLKVHDQYYISSTSPRLDHRTRVLKNGDTFAVFDRVGNVEAIGRNEYGLFHQDTRYLSRLALRMAAHGAP